MEADDVAGLVERATRPHADDVVSIPLDLVVIKTCIHSAEDLRLAVCVKLDHVSAIIAFDVVIVDPDPFFHTTHRYQACLAAVAVEAIVRDIEVSEMTIHHEAEVFVIPPSVVAKIQRVCKVLVILPHVRQQHLETTTVIPLDRAVLHYPMEEIVGVPGVATELIYSLSVVRDQAVVNVNGNLGYVGLIDVPVRRVNANGLLAIVRYLGFDQLNGLVGLPQEVVSDLVQVPIVVGRKYAFLVILNLRLHHHQGRYGAADDFVGDIL